MPSRRAAFPPAPLVAALIGLQAPLLILLAFGVEAWWVDALAHFIPWLALGLLLQTAVFRNRALRVFSLAGAIVLIGLVATAPTAELATKPASRCEGPHLRVTSFNLQITGQDTVAVGPLLDAEQPDLAFFMEVTPEWDRVLRGLAAARGLMYRSAPDPGFYGSAFMSRLPDVEVVFVPHGNDSRRPHPTLHAGDYDIQTAGAPELRARVRHAGETFVMGGAHLSFPLMPKTHGLALGQADQISAWVMDRMTDPTLAGVLLVGDFNSTPFSAILRRLHATAGLTTAVSLWPGTWPASLPVGIAIDHVFVAGRLRVEQIAVGDNLGSDHRPISARIAIEPAVCAGG